MIEKQPEKPRNRQQKALKVFGSLGFGVFFVNEEIGLTARHAKSKAIFMSVHTWSVQGDRHGVRQFLS